MKATFIQDPADLDAQYERLLPIFERVPQVPEFTPRQLFERAKKGLVTIGYCERASEAVIAFAFEFIYYPNMTAVNIIALAGDDFESVAASLLDRLKVFAKLAGADCIEASCSPAGARLLHKYGFEETYRLVRTKL